MMLVHCVASRGRPDHVRQSVATTIKNADNPDTRVVVALDHDDLASAEMVFDDDRVTVSYENRETSLGAKYNRAAAIFPEADAWSIGVDDVAISTPGWDTALAENLGYFEDGYGLVYFGAPGHPSDLPASIAVPNKMADAMGGFCCADYPFWWHDTCLHEYGLMIDRIIRAPIEVEHIKNKVHTIRMRDVYFWATLFDMTRHERAARACGIIDAMQAPDNKKAALRSRLPGLIECLERSNAGLRDYKSAILFQYHQGEMGEPDAGYVKQREIGQARLDAILSGLVFEEKEQAA